ncbi:hypothetical protein [Demequina sediminicola]|uniref:hypothetical protein n=1 Tax=Demequina sediminicola TaxID=1095026 RepID=UPI00078046DD|nr:hypothetical protein [Demequina sediminicola]
MTGLGDELESTARSHGADVARHLTGTDAAVAMSADAAAVRKRRTRVGIGTGAALTGAVALAAWLVAPEPPLPAMQVDDAIVADVPPIPTDFQGMTCDVVENQAYVPWAEPGVTIASDDVRDLGITVNASLWDFNQGAAAASESEVPDRDWTSVEAGTDHTINGLPNPFEPGRSLSVIFDISWEGEAHFEVDAAAFAVAQNRVVTRLGSVDARYVGVTEVEEFQQAATPAEDGRTLVQRIALIDASNCLSGAGSGELMGYLGATEIHTVVQVKNEDGEPLVTYVDSNGIDGTTLEWVAPSPTGMTFTFPPVEPDEVEQLRAERAQLTPVPSSAAIIRDAAAKDGAPLQELGEGFASYEMCPSTDLRVLEEPVIPSGQDPDAEPRRTLPPLPDSLSLAAVQEGGTVQISEGSPEPGLSLWAWLYFVDEAGDTAGVTPAIFSGVGYGGGWEFQAWEGCSTTANLDAGQEYTVVGEAQSFAPWWTDPELPGVDFFDLVSRAVVGDTTLEE